MEKKWICIVLLLYSASSVVQAQSNRRMVQTIILQGQEYLKEEKFEEAIIQFKVAIQYDPKNRQVNQLLKDAEQAYEKKIRQNIDFGRKSLDSLNYAQAIEQFDIALNSGILTTSDQNTVRQYREIAEQNMTRDFLLIYQRGQDYYNRRMYAEAIVEFDAALTIDPNGIVSTERGGSASEYIQYLREQANNQVQNIKNQQEQVQPFLVRGLEYLNLEQYDDAIAEFDAALKIDRNQKEVQNHRQTAINRKEQYEQARGYIRVWSGIEGTVLLNGQATGQTVVMEGIVALIIENAAGIYSVAVKDNNGTIVQAAAPVNIKNTGPSNIYEVRVLNQNPQANAQDDFQITQNSEGGITILAYKGTKKQVIIPEIMYGQKVNIIGSGAFSGKGLVSIVIPEFIKIIEASSFSGNSLTEVIIPDSVTDIKDGAFANCNLNQVTFGKNLKLIGSSSFENNRIEALTIPDGVTLIGVDAFRDNTTLSTLIIPQSLAAMAGGVAYITSGIGNWAFTGCPLTRVTLPANFNSGGGIDSGLLNYYESQGKKAGTYIKNGPVWTRE